MRRLLICLCTFTTCPAQRREGTPTSIPQLKLDPELSVSRWLTCLKVSNVLVFQGLHWTTFTQVCIVRVSSQAICDLNIRYFSAGREQTPLTIWVVGDLDDPQHAELLRQAVIAMVCSLRPNQICKC